VRPVTTGTYSYNFSAGTATDANGLFKVQLVSGTWTSISFDWTPTANRTTGVTVTITASTSAVTQTFHIDDLKIVDTTPDTANLFAIRESVPSGTLIGALSGTRWTGNSVVKLTADAASATEVSEAGLAVSVGGVVQSSIIARQENDKQTIVLGLDNAHNSAYEEMTLLDSRGQGMFLHEHGEHVMAAYPSGQSIPNNTATPVNFASTSDVYNFTAWSSVGSGPGGFTQHTGGGVNPDKFYCTRDGIYLVNGTLQYPAALTTGFRQAYIIKNGVTGEIFGNQVIPVVQNDFAHLNVTAFVPLVAGDYIQMVTFQNSGAAVTTSASATQPNRLSWVRLGRLPD
jgi:hypothetical protein